MRRSGNLVVTFYQGTNKPSCSTYLEIEQPLERGYNNYYNKIRGMWTLTMKDSIIVALAQIDIVLFDQDVNLNKIESCMKQAKEEKNADLIVFPELASIGYISDRSKDFGCKYFKEVSPIPGSFTEKLGSLAEKYGMYVISGMTEAHPKIPATIYDTAVLIDRKGSIAGVQRKVHIPGYEKHWFVPASEIEVFHTELGNIGMGICFDNQFPEYTRTLALKGADFTVMLWNMPTFSNDGQVLWRLTATRAFENRFYAISCNRIGENNGFTFPGYSCVASPLGELIASAEGGETVLYATIERDMLLRERAQMPIFRDRRPDVYSELTKPL